MGRKRASNPLGLPPRVYFRHGAFYYAQRDGKWRHLGSNVKRAIAEGIRLSSGSDHGTVAWWYAEWLTALKKRIGLPKKNKGIAQRTYDDYADARIELFRQFGQMMPADVLPSDVGTYLDDHAETRPVRANREKAAFSSFFSWLVRQEGSGVVSNPCKGIRRNPEQKRERYVEDDEYQAVWKVAQKPVRGLLDLVYRTLQRPEDVIEWTPANIVRKDGKRAIYNRQAKTGAEVWVEITPEIDAILDYLKTAPIKSGIAPMKLIHRRDGRPYAYSGLTTMLSRYHKKTGVASFGFYDMKAKGATDMYLAETPLERIQALCGHDSVRTTEIYVKCRIRTVVAPNRVPLANIQ